MSLNGRVALVTGASKGIGAACAVELARQGATVAVHYNHGAAGAEAVAAECRAVGGDAFCVQAEITQSDSVRAMIAAVGERFGRLDILVNNAGGVDRKPILEHSESDFDYCLALNLKSAFLCIQAALPLLRKGERPNVINISSLSATLGGTPRETGVYGAAKAGLNNLTRTLAQELAPGGIRVNSVSPGYVDTPLQDEKGHREVFERRLRRIPLGRAAQPVEIAQVVVLLASDAASYMTAENVTIGGGL